MEITQSDAVAISSKWHTEETPVRAIHAMKSNGGMTIIGLISELSDDSIHITGDGCELFLNLSAATSFDYQDSREAPEEVGEETKKLYPTLIDISFANGDRTGVLEFVP